MINVKHIYSYADQHGDRHTICDECIKKVEGYSEPQDVPTDYALCEVCRKKMKSDRVLRQSKISLSISISIEQAEELKALALDEGLSLSEYILRKM